ncbi:MAG: hypothetical protein IT223_10115, partial [Crocinitomicaceae bacterium]|nr:hypothetical protein [Crocinitomicaceae bacterium]
MKERFENFAVRLSSSVHHPMALRLFTKAVYGWFLVNVLLTLSDRDYIWGEKTVLLRYGAGDNRLNNLIHILMYDLSLFSPAYYLHIVSAILGMTDRWWT